MYATITELQDTELQVTELQDTEGGRPADVVTRCFPIGVEPDGTLLLDHLDGAGGTVVALWADESAAALTGSRVYRVTDEMHGRAAGRRPLFAQLTWLNGDGDRQCADAAERGGRERIWPAVRDLDGIVETLALRSADDRILVVGLSTGTETYDRVQRAIMATELLPDEEPALLRHPDRVEHARVLLADLPAQVQS